MFSDVKVLNDIIEQAAAGGGSEHGGKLMIYCSPPKYMSRPSKHFA